MSSAYARSFIGGQCYKTYYLSFLEVRFLGFATMKKENKEFLEQIKSECLIDLSPDIRQRITRTDEIHLADILWMVRNTVRHEAQSQLIFSEGMKEIVMLWDLEHDDLKKQFDNTIKTVHSLIFP